MLMKSVTQTLSADDIHSVYAVTGLTHYRRMPNPRASSRYTSLEFHRRPKPDTDAARNAPSDPRHRARLR